MPDSLDYALGYLYLLVPGVWVGLWFHNVVVCYLHRSWLKHALHNVDVVFLFAVIALPIALHGVPAMRRLLLRQPANAAESGLLIALGIVWVVALAFQAATTWRLLHPAEVPHLRSRRARPAHYRESPGDGAWEIHGQTARADCLDFVDEVDGMDNMDRTDDTDGTDDMDGMDNTDTLRHAQRLSGLVVPALAGNTSPNAQRPPGLVVPASAGLCPLHPLRPPAPLRPPGFLARLPMRPPIRAWNHVFHLDLVEIALEFATLPTAFDGLRVLQISDVHLGVELPPGYYRHLIETAKGAEADLIVITGDFTAHDQLHREAVALCARLHAPLGLWAVRGNHDFYTEPDVLAWYLARAGIGLLKNRAVDIVADAPGPRQVLRLVGVEHPHVAVSDWRALLDAPAEERRLWTPRVGTVPSQPSVPPERERPARTLVRRKPEARRAGGTLALPATAPAQEAAPFRLVLSHRPDYVRELAPAGADLVLAGHTHGGQWRLPLVGPFILPSLYGRLYAEGFHVLGSTLLYTSHGAGVHTVPFRYRCPPEITLFTLRRP